MTIGPDSKPALATFVHLGDDPLSGNAVLRYPGGFLELDAAAHEILGRCDGATTVDEIIAALRTDFEGDAADVTREVLATLRQLAARDLIVFVA